MTEQDKKVRKQWLIVWIACNVISSIVMFVPSSLNRSFYLVSVLSSLLSLVVVNLIIYLCAYRKPGTKFLTVCIVMTMISLVYVPFLDLSGKMTPVDIPYYGAYRVISYVASILWLITSWNMRKVNKRLQASK